MNTYALADKLLASGLLNEPNKYTLADLFKIRDALNILDFYDLADKDLLNEVNKFINQF